MKIISKISLYLFTFLAIAVSTNSIAYAVADTIPPTKPGTPSATTNVSGQVSLSWGVSTDNVGVAGYYVYRNGAQIANVVSTSYTDIGLSPAVYSYTVAAYDAAGNISNQSAQVLVTPVIDTTPPSTPTGLSATVTYNPTQVTLSWTASTDNLNVVAYYVYRNGIHLRTYSPITGTSYTDTDVTAGSTYTYTVIAYDPAGNSSARSSPLNVSVVIDNEAPYSPTNVSAVATSSSAIAVSWASSTDNVGVVGYYVYRNGTKVGTVASTSLSYVDSGISPNTYTYTIAAYDLAGNISIQSTPVTATIVSDTTPPSIPIGISAIVNSTSQVSISWNPSNDNVGVIGYNVYRNGNRITAVNKNFYSDTNLTASTTYSYAVSAYDISGNVSSSSIPAIVTTPNINSVQAITTNNTLATSATVANQSAPTLTYQLSRGARNSQVQSLQDILIKLGYLTADSNTGYFGPATEKGVQKFQCDNSIACSSAATGWGIVDGKTRDLLNSLSTDTGNASSTAQLVAQIQVLQALLAKLLLQVQALNK